MRAEKVDIVDENDQPTGEVLSWEEANRQGKWFRGVHLAVFTRRGEILLQKRSSEILTNPNEWDLTLGGVVDAGETFASAALRETDEEMGLKFKESDLKEVMLWKYNYPRPSLGFHTKALVQVYLVEIPAETNHFRLEPKEASAAEYISLETAEELVRTGQFSDGELVPLHSLYQSVIEAIKSELQRR